MIYALISISLLVGYIPLMYPSFSWELSLLSREVIILLMSFLAVYLCSWRIVKIKCVLLINVIYQSVCFASSVYALYLQAYGLNPINIYWSVATVSIFSIWAVHQCMRKFRGSSDVLNDTHYFYGLYIPHGVNGITQTLFSCLYGGICVYQGGYVWRYRRGVMVRSPYRYVSNKDIVWINTYIKKDDHFDNELDSLIGRKWKWYSNCFHNLQIFKDIKKSL